MLKHLDIKIFGKVQGVSFRYYAREQARCLRLGGYIKNDSRGSVSIEAEGEEKDLKGFLEWCRKGPDTAHVENVEFTFNPEMKNYTEFKIY